MTHQPRERGTPLVLDTNVLLAASFSPDSHSGRLVAKVRSGACRMIWHEKTRAECRRLFERIPPVRWEEAEDLFRPEDRYEGALDTGPFAAVPDPDDRKFAALAAATGATLVSLDADLLDADLGAGPRVVRPGKTLGVAEAPGESPGGAVSRDESGRNAT